MELGKVKQMRQKFYLTALHPYWGWIRMKPFEKRVRPVEHSDSHDEVMYLGLIDILKSVSPGSSVLVIVDTEPVCEQLNGKRIYDDPPLRVLRKDVRKLVEKRELELQVQYLSPWNHLARRLIKSWIDSTSRIREGTSND